MSILPETQAAPEQFQPAVLNQTQPTINVFNSAYSDIPSNIPSAPPAQDSLYNLIASTNEAQSMTNGFGINFGEPTSSGFQAASGLDQAGLWSMSQGYDAMAAQDFQQAAFIASTTGQSQGAGSFFPNTGAPSSGYESPLASSGSTPWSGNNSMDISGNGNIINIFQAPMSGDGAVSSITGSSAGGFPYQPSSPWGGDGTPGPTGTGGGGLPFGGDLPVQLPGLGSGNSFLGDLGGTAGIFPSVIGTAASDFGQGVENLGGDISSSLGLGSTIGQIAAAPIAIPTEIAGDVGSAIGNGLSDVGSAIGNAISSIF